jgi:hypothetical protein
MIERLAAVLGDEMQRLYPQKTEEKFPRIVEKIGVLWGSPQMAKYFTELLFDDRGGRQGFPPDIMTELFRLANFYDTLKPARTAVDAAWENREMTRLDRFDGVTKG